MNKKLKPLIRHEDVLAFVKTHGDDLWAVKPILGAALDAYLKGLGESDVPKGILRYMTAMLSSSEIASEVPPPQNRILAHYGLLRNKTIYAHVLHGYVGEDSVTRVFSSPVAVRVIETNPESLAIDHDTHIDSDYDVEPIDPHDPRIADMRSFWVDGLSVNVETGAADDLNFIPPGQGERDGNERIKTRTQGRSRDTSQGSPKGE